MKCSGIDGRYQSKFNVERQGLGKVGGVVKHVDPLCPGTHSVVRWSRFSAQDSDFVKFASLSCFVCVFFQSPGT